MEWRPVWADDDVALARARDVLDRQHVDTSGVQVVRAADAYLLNGPQGWELAGIDVGLLSLAEGSLPAQGLPAAGSGHRLGSVAGVRAAIHRYDTAWESAPTTAAGTAGSRLQLGARPPARR
jgi:hypothetical protein